MNVKSIQYTAETNQEPGKISKTPSSTQIETLLDYIRIVHYFYWGVILD